MKVKATWNKIAEHSLRLLPLLRDQRQRRENVKVYAQVEGVLKNGKLLHRNNPYFSHYKNVNALKKESKKWEHIMNNLDSEGQWE